MTGDGSDDTPREHIATDSERHYATYPPGTLAVRESVIAPRNAFEQQLEGRVDDLERQVASLAGSRSFWKWVAGLALPLAFAALGALLVYSVNKLEASSERAGEVRAEIRALSKLIDLLESEVVELRRHAGLDKTPTVALDLP